MEREKMDKERAYRRYLETHVKNVKRVWMEVKEEQERKISENDFVEIENLIHVHDNTKFDREEFHGYRQWFYPMAGEHRMEYYFKRAWNHHQKHNPHHWEYWVMQDGTVLDMDLKYIVEMLCDWTAMSIAMGDTPTEFYTKRKDNMIFAPYSREIVEALLSCFNMALNNLRRSDGT